METHCEICAFNNPRATASGVVIRDGKILLTKRATEPFKDMWDIPGGYMHYGELPADALVRELREELGVNAKPTFLNALPGTASYHDKEYAVISFNFLADIGAQEISLNEENSALQWVPIRDLNPDDIAFDSNQALGRFIKQKFNFDLPRIRELVGQLDSSADVKEHALYQATLCGYVATEFDGEKLIGMGWIFPRQTALRRQAVVEDMIVDEAYRGTGLGRKILDGLVRWAENEGVEMIELTSNPLRIAANGLYQKHGFKLHPTNHYLYKVS